MFFDFDTLPVRDRTKLLNACITPRPIAWVVTRSAGGVLNAAPFSYFSPVCGDPPLISIAIGRRPGGEGKDSLRNIADTGEFVVNIVPNALREPMNTTSGDVGPEVDELALAGLATEPGIAVSVPRIAGSPAALECRLHQVIDVAPGRSIVLGRVCGAIIDDANVIDGERCYVDQPGFDVIGRLHGDGWYTRTREVFRMPTPKADKP